MLRSLKRLANPFLFGGRGGGDTLAELGLLVLRVTTGLFLAIGHGWEKVPPSQGFVNFVESTGAPAPYVSALMAGLGEFVGGILLALGLFTRPAAVWLIGVFVVATFVAHPDSFGSVADFFLPDRPGEQNAAEPAAMYLLLAVTFLMVGSGRTGLDRFLRR